MGSLVRFLTMFSCIQLMKVVVYTVVYLVFIDTPTFPPHLSIKKILFCIPCFFCAQIESIKTVGK